MCEFQSLYCSESGYVIRCKSCGQYQVAFISTVITLTDSEFEALCTIVKHKCLEEDFNPGMDVKSVAIPTYATGIYMLLTPKETLKFSNVLDAADNENKALNMMRLFNA